MKALRVCRSCGLEANTEEDLELFAKGKAYLHGRDNLCRECKNRSSREYYQTHPNPECWRKWRLKHEGHSSIMKDSRGTIRCFVVQNGKLRRRSHLVMEEVLGRSLTPNEVAHHINGDTLDDRKENLKVMTRSEHSHHHAVSPEQIKTNLFYRSGSQHPAWKGDNA